MKIGDSVRIVRCEKCPKVVGKTVKVVKLVGENPNTGLEVSYGRGRPQLNRPNVFDIQDVEVII